MEDSETSEKRIKCKFCSISVNNLQEFYRHANKKHAEVVSREWQSCSVCRKCFPTTGDVTDHQNKAHLSKTNR